MPALARSNRYPGGASAPASTPKARPIPANDNTPQGRPRPVRPPLPANDNTPGVKPRIPSGVSKPAAKAAQAVAGRMLARTALRMVPILGWLLTAYELYQLYGQLTGMVVVPAQGPRGYYNHTECCYTATCAPSGGRWGYSQTTVAPCGAGNWTNQNNVTPFNWSSFPVRVYEIWRLAPNDPSFSNSVTRVGTKIRWEREATGPYAPPKDPFALPPLPFIPWVPALDPFVPPLIMPEPLPIPLPVRRPGYRPRDNPEDVMAPRGYAPPRTAPENASDTAGRPSARSRAAPAGRGTKERKVKANAGIRKLLGEALSGYSEVGDAVDVFYDALPDEYQKKSDKTLWDKVETLYQNWDKVSMPDAVIGLIQNDAEDKRLAEGFKRVQDGLAEWGLEVPDLRDMSGGWGTRL